MGHLSGKLEFDALQQRLEKNPIGAPGNKAFFDILEELFTREECRIAATMPMKMATARRIASYAQSDENHVQEIINSLVRKGLVVDLPRDDGKVFYFLNPPMIGFFEFTMMRVRNNIDQKKVANLMWEYFREDPDLAFLRMIGKGETFLARPLVHEDALTPEVYSEVLDWEKATHMVSESDSWAKGMCHCRHIKLHMDKRCDYPMDICLSLGFGAKYLVRAGVSQAIDKSEAMDILVKSRELGLVQMGDNVKNRATFICNCCKCCCEMMEGFRTLPNQTMVITSNYVAKANEEACNGCGKCAKACPVDVIELIPAEPSGKAKKRKKRAQVNEQFCLGCGVCHRECKFDAMTLESIGVREYTPDTTMEKMMVVALEQGKLHHMLFANPNSVTHKTLGLFLKTILELPPAKQLLAKKQIRSKFVSAMLNGFSKTKDGWMAEL